MLDIQCQTERDAKWVGSRWCASGNKRKAILRRSRISYAQLETVCSVYLLLDGTQVKHLVVAHEAAGQQLINYLWPTSSRRSCQIVDRYLNRSRRQQMRNRLSEEEWEALTDAAFKKSWAAAGVTDFAAKLSEWVKHHVESPKKFGSPAHHPFFNDVSEETSRKLKKQLRASER